MPYLCYDGFINREPEKPFCSGETGAGRVDNREVINDVLVNLFNEILRLEEEAIITDKYKDISNNDMHIIEAVGLGGGNMSSIAAKLKITVGSLTTSMNSLVKKGYVKRERSEKDRRVVFIQLTNKLNYFVLRNMLFAFVLLLPECQYKTYVPFPQNWSL